MAKEKVIDLKAKAENVTEDELKELRSSVGSITSILNEIGRLEAQKHEFLHHYATVQDQISMLKSSMVEKYGTYDINIETGKINYAEDAK